MSGLTNLSTLKVSCDDIAKECDEQQFDLNQWGVSKLPKNESQIFETVGLFF